MVEKQNAGKDEFGRALNRNAFLGSRGGSVTN
jgi:hypothetical protein